MEALQVFLKNKLYIKIATFLVLGLSALYTSWVYYNMLEKQRTENRQLAGFLSKAEQKLLEQKTKFNLAKSELVATNKELETEANKYLSDYTDLNADFQQFVEDHNLKMTQYEHRIYNLKQSLKASKDKPPVVTTIVKEGECSSETIIEYEYQDPYKRLVFKTPNCLTTGGESFTLNQTFSIYGEVYKQKDGLLKVSSLILKELNPQNIKEVIATANLQSSDFKYIAEKIIEKQYSFTLGAGFDSNTNINLNLGYNIYKVKDFTLNLAANYIHKKTIHPSLKVMYSPTILGKQTNFGFSGGLGYSVDDGTFFILGVDFGAW